MAESYDASSSNSDGLSMMTIPPSIDRSSIPEESYLLAESKWWRLIEEGLIKKKKKLVPLPRKFHLFHYFSSPFILFVWPRFSLPLERGERKRWKGDKKYFRAGWDGGGGEDASGKSSLREINVEAASFFFRRERNEN